MDRLSRLSIFLSALALPLSQLGHLVPVVVSVALWAVSVVVGHMGHARMKRGPEVLPVDVRLSRALLVASWISLGGTIDPTALTTDAAALWAGLLALVTVAVGTPRGR